MDIRELALGDIIVDERFQIRKQTTRAKVKAYVIAYKSGAEMPPVTVADINGALCLIDGFHRVKALKHLGADRVEAEVIKTTEAEAVWLGAKANLQHGIQLKPRDRRPVFRAYMKAGKWKEGGKRQKRKSFRDISAELGGLVPHTTARLWMREDFPRAYREYTDEGNQRKTGGNLDWELSPMEGHLIAASHEGIKQAIANFRGVKDPEARGWIIKEMKEALEEATAAGDFVAVEDLPF